jgi:hypothetical protein
MQRSVLGTVILLILCTAVTASVAQNYPRLSVFEAHYPNPSAMNSPANDWVFEGTEGDPVILDLAAPLTIWFTWFADADHYGGTIVGYRSTTDGPYDPDYTSTGLGEFYYGSHNFMVEVMDDAGIVTRAEFKINIDALPWPRLQVTETNFGTWNFHDPSLPAVDLTIPAGTQFSFSWQGFPTPSGGLIVGYRTVQGADFDPDLLSATAGPYFYGTHQFLIEVKDEAGTITSALFRINVDQNLPVKQSTWGAIKALYR